jgi:hypothetical protein
MAGPWPHRHRRPPHGLGVCTTGHHQAHSRPSAQTTREFASRVQIGATPLLCSSGRLALRRTLGALLLTCQLGDDLRSRQLTVKPHPSQCTAGPRCSLEVSLPLQAATCGRPQAAVLGRRKPGGGNPHRHAPDLHRPRAARAAPWKPTPRCGPADSAGRSEIAHGSSAVEGPQKVRAAYAIPYSYLDELFFA